VRFISRANPAEAHTYLFSVILIIRDFAPALKRPRFFLSETDRDFFRGLKIDFRVCENSRFAFFKKQLFYHAPEAKMFKRLSEIDK